MKRFIKRSIAHCCLILTASFVIFFIVTYLQNGDKKKGAIYIWGDSIIHHAIDPSLLSSLTNKQVLTASHNGAGIYDLIAVSKYIPDSSVFFIGWSEFMLVKNPEVEYNRTVFSLSALWKTKYNFPSISLKNLFFDNLKQNKIFSTHTTALPFADTIVCTQTMDSFSEMFLDTSFINIKNQMLVCEFKKMADRDIQVIFLKFPITAELDELIKNSNCWNLITEFEKNVTETKNISLIDFREFCYHKNIFYDFNHLNSLGRNLISKKIYKEMF